jgi:Starch-binding associating with outer membrane
MKICIMKNNILYKLILPAAILALTFSSCTKKIDDAFANPNALTKQPVEELLPGVISNMAIQHSANGTLYGPQNDGLYFGRYVQFWATNTTGNQYDQMGDNFINRSDVLGSIWAMHYYGMGANISRIIEWGTEEKKWDYVGVAQAVRAWAWMTLTDVHDDVILREAFRPEQLVFKYDPQPDVYEEVKRLCHEALANLSKTGDGMNPANLARSDRYGNGGDLNRWKKFTYGVLARTFHRVTNKSIYQPDSVIYYANLAMQANSENTNITWSNTGGTGTYSFWSPFRANVGALRQSKFIADLMSGINTQFPTNSVDPRAPYIIRENPLGTYKGIRPNKGSDLLTNVNERPDNFWGGAFSITAAPGNDDACRYIFKNAPIFPIMTAAEMQFVKAEALLRKGDKASALVAYKKGIELNIAELRANYETSVPTALRMNDTQRDAFLNNATIVPSAANLTLSHIMMQKFIAMYGWGVTEVWVDMRRYHYTDLDPVTGQQVYREFAPPTGIDLYTNNLNKWIYRVRPRYNSEYLYNVDELNRLGAFAPDYITKECWFSKP